MRRFRLWRRRKAAFALLPVSALLTTTSMAMAAADSTQGAHIAASDAVVPFGERITLAGSVPGGPGTGVGLKFRPAGSSDWAAVRDMTTDGAGNYRTVIRARRSGAFQAVPAEGQPSEPVKIRIRARASLHAANSNPLVGGPVRLHGRVQPQGRRMVRVRVGRKTIRTSTGPSGAFSVSWTPRRSGNYKVQALTDSDHLARAGRSPTRRVTAFRRAAASWYGPGLYGNPLACGGTLAPDTLGVANKTLPCGTKLTLRYHGRSVRVRVIDRGPFSGSREFDLTEATKQRLGFPEVGYVLSSR